MSALLAERRFQQTPHLIARQPIRREPQNYPIQVAPVEHVEQISISLRDEVNRIKSEPLRSNTPWYYLAGTGFYVREQVSQMMNGINNSIRENTYPGEVIDGEMLKVKEDITAFEQEYLRQLLLLPITLERKAIGGRDSIIAPKYNGKLWKDTVARGERNGAIYQSLFDSQDKGKQSIQDWLLVSPPGAMAIMISPSGWSGLEDARGNKIIYPETQIYVWQVQADGQPKGFAFRYNPSFSQSVEFQKRLGLPEIPTEETPENIIAMVKNVAFLNPGNGIIKSFQDIVSLMREVKRSPIAYQGKSFDEIRQLLTEPETLWNHDVITLNLIEEFQNYARFELSNLSSDTEKNLQIGLAVTILQITNNYKRKSQDAKAVDFYHGNTTFRRSARDYLPDGAIFARLNYQDEAQELKKLPGCGGGGSKLEEEEENNGLGLTRINSAINRAGKVVGNEDVVDFSTGEGVHEGTCVNCKQGPRPVGLCNICEACVGTYFSGTFD